MVQKFFFLFVFISVPVFSKPQVEKPLIEWIGEKKSFFISQLKKNISPLGSAPGVVIAAPSSDRPNYYFHWVRDAALVMDFIIQEYKQEKIRSRKNDLQKMLLDYVDFSRKNQETPTLSFGFGEPKFHVDGKPFQGDWGRPQNDGPALRAIALIRLAQIWLDEGKQDLVREKLYRNELPALQVIKADLEFISHHWNMKCFDLWEEIRGYHFYTRLVQRRALWEGALLAERLGDWGASYWYKWQANALSSLIADHFQESKGWIESTLDRDGGIDYKKSNLDSSIALAVLHTLDSKGRDRFFSTLDSRVIRTIDQLERVFEKLYKINQNKMDGAMEVAIGRYPEDQYDGIDTNRDGNPWVLTTAALGEWYYRLAQEIEERGEFLVERNILSFMEKLSFSDFQIGGKIQVGNPNFSKLLLALQKKGDQFLQRLRYHSADGRFFEQMNRNTGFQQGAPDLTWSYVSVLTAISEREKLAEKIPTR